MEMLKQKDLIIRRHRFDDVPDHLKPDCPACGEQMVKDDYDVCYQQDFDLHEAYQDAGFNFDADVFSFANDIYICCECHDDDCDPPSAIVTEVRWYYLFGDNYQSAQPIHPSEYENIHALMYQRDLLANGQLMLDGFHPPDFEELENIYIVPR